MPMEIEEHKNSQAFMNPGNKLFYHSHLRIEVSVGIEILPVEILARCPTSGVPNDNSIRVAHGDNNKVDPIPQLLSLIRITA